MHLPASAPRPFRVLATAHDTPRPAGDTGPLAGPCRTEDLLRECRELGLRADDAIALGRELVADLAVLQGRARDERRKRGSDWFTPDPE